MKLDYSVQEFNQTLHHQTKTGVINGFEINLHTYDFNQGYFKVTKGTLYLKVDEVIYLVVIPTDYDIQIDKSPFPVHITFIYNKELSVYYIEGVQTGDEIEDGFETLIFATVSFHEITGEWTIQDKRPIQLKNCFLYDKKNDISIKRITGQKPAQLGEPIKLPPPEKPTNDVYWLKLENNLWKGNYHLMRIGWVNLIALNKNTKYRIHFDTTTFIFNVTNKLYKEDSIKCVFRLVCDDGKNQNTDDLYREEKTADRVPGYDKDNPRNSVRPVQFSLIGRQDHKFEYSWEIRRIYFELYTIPGSIPGDYDPIGYHPSLKNLLIKIEEKFE